MQDHKCVLFLYFYRFSVEVYFFILMGIMIMSFVAFILINTLSQFQSERASSSSIMIRTSGSSSSSHVGEPDNIHDVDESFPPRSISPVLREYQQNQAGVSHQSGIDHIQIEKREDQYLPIRYVSVKKKLTLHKLLELSLIVSSNRHVSSYSFLLFQSKPRDIPGHPYPLFCLDTQVLLSPMSTNFHLFLVQRSPPFHPDLLLSSLWQHCLPLSSHS